MAKVTLREKYIAVLKHRGYVKDFDNRSRKYIKMVKYDNVRGNSTYWVGTHGGLRIGRTASDSYGVLDIQKQRMIEYYDRFCK